MAGARASVLVAFLLIPFVPLLAPLVLAVAFATLILAIVRDRLGPRHVAELPPEWAQPAHEERTLVARDGVTLRYYILRGQCQPELNGEKPPGRVVLLCNPLGNCGLRLFAPVIATFTELWGESTTFVCWDYRSFFDTDQPKRPPTVSVRDHAEDGAEVLAAAVGHGVPADVVVGHSMGVQVALELALLWPELARTLVLMNGTSGHLLQTGLQPLIKLPYFGDALSATVLWILRRGEEWRLDIARMSLMPLFAVAIPLCSFIFGSTPLRKRLGKKYLSHWWWDYYIGAVGSSRKTMTAFLRGFLELDAHRTDHVLWQIEQPALLIAGLFDILTPAYCMQHMAACMPNATLIVDSRSGHLTAFEHPERVVGEITRFFEARAVHVTRS